MESVESTNLAHCGSLLGKNSAIACGYLELIHGIGRRSQDWRVLLEVRSVNRRIRERMQSGDSRRRQVPPGLAGRFEPFQAAGNSQIPSTNICVVAIYETRPPQQLN